MSDISQLAGRVERGEGEWGSKLPVSLNYLVQGEGEGQGQIHPLRCLDYSKVSPEVEFWNGIFLDINSSLLRLEFLFGFLPSFSVLQNAFQKQARIFLFRGFFVWIFLKPEKRMVFFKILQ
jgi:hypothetical protein